MSSAAVRALDFIHSNGKYTYIISKKKNLFTFFKQKINKNIEKLTVEK